MSISSTHIFPPKMLSMVSFVNISVLTEQNLFLSPEVRIFDRELVRPENLSAPVQKGAYLY